MRLIFIAAIRFYQRFISPHKGFCCAYRSVTGHRSCSVLGLRVIQRYGVVHGLRVLQQRLYLCGVAKRRYQPTTHQPWRTQRGDCDVGGCIDCGDIACCDPGCDWPQKRKPSKDEKQVYLPPKKGLSHMELETFQQQGFLNIADILSTEECGR